MTLYTHHRSPQGNNTAVLYHHCTEVRALNGGSCSLLVRRIGGVVQLLHHAVWEGTAELTDEQARAVGQALIDAAAAR